ncbi:hypothetical protein J1614_007610 [Plenodomus biglobosus]|nr:hypothetical protein J1614_007610 [Plenodomus biglobosus]
MGKCEVGIAGCGVVVVLWEGAEVWVSPLLLISGFVDVSRPTLQIMAAPPRKPTERLARSVDILPKSVTIRRALPRVVSSAVTHGKSGLAYAI